MNVIVDGGWILILQISPHVLVVEYQVDLRVGQEDLICLHLLTSLMIIKVVLGKQMLVMSLSLLVYPLFILLLEKFIRLSSSSFFHFHLSLTTKTSPELLPSITIINFI